MSGGRGCEKETERRGEGMGGRVAGVTVALCMISGYNSIRPLYYME